MLFFRLSLFVLPALTLVGTQWVDTSSNFWNDNNNWVPPLFPFGNTASATFDNLLVPGATISLGQDITVGSISYSTNSSYTIDNSGNTLTLDSTPAVVSNAGGVGTQTIACPVTCTDAVTFQNVSGAPNLTFSGAVTLNGTVLTAMTISGGVVLSGPVGMGNVVAPGKGAVIFDATQNGTATVSGTWNLGGTARIFNIGNGSAAIDMLVSGDISSGGIIKMGAGTLALTGSNDASLTMTVSAGVLQVQAGSLPMSVTNNASIVFDQGTPGLYNGNITGSGSLTKQNAGTLIFTGSNSYSGGTTVSGGVLQGNTSSLQGTITNNTSVIFNQTGTGTYAGSMGGSGSMTLQGGGQLTLTGANTYAGGTTVSAGTLVTNAASLPGNINMTAAGVTLSFNAAAGGTYGGNISGSGSVTLNGTGTVTLSGNNNYSGVTQINNAGTLKMGSATAFSGTSRLALTGSGATFDLNGFSATFPSISGSANTTITSSTAGAVTLTCNTATAQTVSSVIQNGAGTVAVQKGGALTWILLGANTYTGGTTVSAGVLQGNATSLQGAIVNNASVVFDQSTLGTYGGAMSGSGSLTKQNTGTLVLSGSNSYGGGTTVNGGVLQGTTASLQGAILNNTAVVFDQSTSGTYGGAMSGPGSLTKQNTGTVILSGSNSYGGGTTVSGGVLQGTTISLQGTIVNNASVVFNQGTNGTYAGAMSGSGGLTKSGSGIVTLSSTNTYGGSTTISGGTLRMGNAGALSSTSGMSLSGSGATLDLNTFNLTVPNLSGVSGTIVTSAGGVTLTTGGDNSNQTFGGSIQSSLAVDKQGSGIWTLAGANTYTGATTVSAGTLAVTGSLGGGGSLTVALGATLQGTGTITKACVINGDLSPGSSIGTITLVGNQVFATGSTLNIELNPTMSDRVNVTGALTIQSGVTLNIIPDFGVYQAPLAYLIIDTTGGITGTFSTVTSSLPLFNIDNIVQTMDDILIVLSGGFMPFADIITTGNANQAAQALDSLSAASCCDISMVIATLRFIPTTHALKEALLQLQPALYTDFALAQEDNTHYVQNTIDHRLDDKTRSPCASTTSLTVWATLLGGHTSQHGTDSSPGFVANTPGVFVGIDSRLGQFSCVGCGVGYTYTSLNWRDIPRSFGNVCSRYAACYGKWATSRLSVYSTLLGGYTLYSAHRKMRFGDIVPVHTTAHSRHPGGEVGVHVKAGYKALEKQHTVLTPFATFDYLFLHEAAFRERGAQCLNLKVHSHNADLMAFEAGLDWTAPFLSGCRQYAPFIKLSAVQEIRFLGRHETASFQCGSSMFVRGQNPQRTLGNVEAGFSGGLFSYDDLRVAFQARFGHDYRNLSGYLEYNYRF